MPHFTESDNLQGAEFRGVNLRRARFHESDLSGVVMRGVELAQVDLDAPWLPHGGYLLVNGVDVTPYVEAELDQRFPGRAERRAADPEGLASAWSALERTWLATLARAAAMPAGSVDASVAGEWSFAQTLRHLVHATDIWLRKGILELEDALDPTRFTSEPPAYDEVLRVRAERVAMVRDFIAATTPQQLAEPRRNPHDPAHPESVLGCLHVILEEEWEHHRFAVRDLDALEAAREDSDDDSLGGGQS